MANCKVVFTDYLEPDLNWEAEQCREMGIDLAAYQLKTAGPDELARVTCDADIVVTNMAQMNDRVIAAMQRCKLIIRHGIGYDNVDIQAAAERGIQVVNIPDYCVNEVAEQALTLIMASQRKLLQQNRALRLSAQAGTWQFEDVDPVYRLAGKTVGIVGFGRIGSTVFRMLQGFGVNFVITDPYINEERKQQFGISTAPLEQLLRMADVVTVHVPLKWEETYHMFDAPQFELMKPTAVLVNTSRGAVVNLDALDHALRQGRPAMAGIDVYEKEPPAAAMSLLDNPKVICTPHLSWLSVESGESIRHKIVEDIRRFHRGEAQPYPVNTPVEP